MTATVQRKEVTINVQPLTPEAYAPYGRVVENARVPLEMKDGQFTARLMTVERAPETIKNINMHTDHSQLFIPLGGDRLVVVVAPPDVPAENFDPEKIVAFLTDGKTAFTFHPGTWHIEPRAVDKDSCQVINVQTDVFREYTTLIHLADEGAKVRLQMD